MDRKKIIYIGILLIITVVVSVMCFSYAFFTNKSEQHGKLNIVAGTLDYQIESNDLKNNAITLESNTTKVIEIKITSLNTINSKYELYYNSDNNIEIGYDNNNDSPTGIINKNESKNLIITIKNKNSNSTTVTFGVEGGLISNNLILSIGNSITEIINNNCLYESGYVWDFPFDPDGDGKGQEQTFEIPCDGTYQLEVWGAQGGGVQSGYGGYSTGNIQLVANAHLYIVVGGAGMISTSDTNGGGYNGGGHGTNVSQPGSGGGGATHIATTTGLLSSLSSSTDKAKILIVAGGGGGSTTSANTTNGNGGSGGGYLGVTGGYYNNLNWSFYGTGGSQTSGGVCYLYGTNVADSGSFGSFGKGGNHGYEGSSNVGGSGGGGGYYGGGGSSRSHGQAGGGSGYIGNASLTSKSMYCYNCAQDLTNQSTFTVSTTGTSTYRDTANCPNGYSSDPISKCAMANNGYARITYLGN